MEGIFRPDKNISRLLGRVFQVKSSCERMCVRVIFRADDSFDHGTSNIRCRLTIRPVLRVCMDFLRKGIPPAEVVRSVLFLLSTKQDAYLLATTPRTLDVANESLVENQCLRCRDRKHLQREVLDVHTCMCSTAFLGKTQVTPVTIHD